MANIVKEKNFLIFTNNKGNSYRFDISTGIMYSTKGKAMASQPEGLVSYMRNYGRQEKSMVLGYMYYEHEWYSAKYNDFSERVEELSLYDRLDSIGYYNSSMYHYDKKEIEFLHNNFKKFAKAYKNNNELTIREFIAKYQEELFYQELKIKVDDYYTEEILRLVYNMYRNTINPKDISTYRLIAYYLSRGVYMFFNDNQMCSYSRNYIGFFNDYFEMCEAIGYEPTKDDFFKQYLMVKKVYLANKKKYDNEKIQKQYEKHSNIWDFETDELFIYVPTCSDDFKDEGEQQSNCVYTMYLEKVLRGDTNVIFIRKKDNPKKSYITCEVTNDGYINQYYYAHNCYVPREDKAENDFRLGLIDYIATHWND